VGGQYLRTTYNRLSTGAAPVRRTMAKKSWDRLDEEAEREGSAFKIQLKQISRVGWGKKITKQRNAHTTIEIKINNKLLKNTII
jgi:hypothetical protein